jgi:hypothetical protein
VAGRPPTPLTSPSAGGEWQWTPRVLAGHSWTDRGRHRACALKTRRIEGSERSAFYLFIYPITISLYTLGAVSYSRSGSFLSAAWPGVCSIDSTERAAGTWAHRGLQICYAHLGALAAPSRMLIRRMIRRGPVTRLQHFSSAQPQQTETRRAMARRRAGHCEKYVAMLTLPQGLTPGTVP